MRDFRKYDVWQLAHGLFWKYKVTKTFPREESFGLTGQIRRAVLSIPTNICEGWEILMRILEDFFKSHSSSHEVEYLIQLSKELMYISPDYADELAQKINVIKKSYSI
jgi:four helix bundle protein